MERSQRRGGHSLLPLAGVAHFPVWILYKYFSRFSDGMVFRVFRRWWRGPTSCPRIHRDQTAHSALRRALGGGRF